MSFYFCLKNNSLWKEYVISIVIKLEKWKLIITIFTLLYVINDLLFRLIGGIIFYQDINSEKYSNAYKVDGIFTFSYSLMLLFGFITWWVCVWFYRKITLEYYIKNNQPISWGYFFAQTPIIGFFVWIYNFIVFNKKEEFNKELYLKRLNNTNNGIKILIYSTLIIYFIILLLTPKVSNYIILFCLIGFAILLIYINHRNGIYIYVFNSLIILGLLLYFNIIYDFNDLVKPNYFYDTESQINELKKVINLVGVLSFISIANMYIIHPIFHLKNYKIECKNIGNKEE